MPVKFGSDLDRFAVPVDQLTASLAPRDEKGRRLVPARAENPDGTLLGDGLIPEGSGDGVA